MAWSKITNNDRKPLLWWYYKIMAEIGWMMRGKDGYSMYCKYLFKMIDDCKRNIYGEEV